MANFLNRLSKGIGASVENPEGLTPLRPFLSSKEMLIVLDNAESILDPQGSDAQQIYAVVEELSQISNISLCITSRITTIPSDCKRLDVPTLSMDAARSAFYRIYDKGERSNDIDNLLEQLDFHPLSVTLLATVAHQNNWDNNRLVREWEEQQTSVLKTGHRKSLAAAIGLSLTSPMFRELGHSARELLGVVAFFPQGIDENNLDWLFPTIADRMDIINVFCILSLTSRSNGFITMLAPLRDYLAPRDPRTSSLLCMAKDRYFGRLRASGYLKPDKPGFGESQWITSEDVNVEHLLDVFTSLDENSDDIWDACAKFINHLYWHKPRSTVLRPKIEGLSDDHRSKLQCLLQLSQLFRALGKFPERKSLLAYILELARGQGDDDRVAYTLWRLADTNRLLGLHGEGIGQSREALEIYERLGDAEGQAKCLNYLARLLLEDKQLDVAEEAGSHAINIFLDLDRKFWVCASHRLLGLIHQSKGNREKAVQHFGEALGIASSFGWHNLLFWTHHSLARLYSDENDFDNAQSHIERAGSHTVNDACCLGRAMEMQARIWCRRGQLEEAKAEALRALEAFEKLGATTELRGCRNLLREIELDGKKSTHPGESRPQW